LTVSINYNLADPLFLFVANCFFVLASRQHERANIQIIMPALLAFMENGGIDTLNSMLRIFSDEVCKGDAEGVENSTSAKVALFGLKKILDLYVVIVSGKNLSESISQFALLPRIPPDRRVPDVPITNQVVVELRMAILPVIRELWDSALIERAPDPTLNRIIVILKTISAGDHEPSTYQSDKVCAVNDKPIHP
jgi:E3 ubiquitin-protein ligase HUWE1